MARIGAFGWLARRFWWSLGHVVILDSGIREALGAIVGDELLKAGPVSAYAVLASRWVPLMRMTVVMLAVSKRRDASPRNCFHGGCIEPAAELIGPCHREVLAGDGEEAAVLELVLEGFHLGFVGLERQVGLADRVGEGLCSRGCGIEYSRG